MYVNGRVSTFIELGVGFNMELPARENVIINAAMLGLPPREGRRRLDRVLEFAELEEFADLRLKNYSSGMLVRLAFAVMIQVDADVLLIDEVLAVGDASFQQKCFDEFARLRREGRTVVLVTHDMGAVERFCDRALLLERGRPEMIGDTHEVALRYLDLNFAREERRARAGGCRSRPVGRWPGGDPRGVVRGRRRPARGGAPQRTTVARSRPGRGSARTWRTPSWASRSRTPSSRPCSPPTRSRSTRGWGRSARAKRSPCRIAFDNVFRPDRYYATPAIAQAGTGLAWLDRRERFAEVVVTGASRTEAIVDLPYDVALERGGVESPRSEVAG